MTPLLLVSLIIAVSADVLTCTSDDEDLENTKRKISHTTKRTIAMARCPDDEFTVRRVDDGSTMLLDFFYETLLYCYICTSFSRQDNYLPPYLLLPLPL
mmetsp:Transcript_18181/g.29809  ORF Transcript_18181/g.29809 Transcript_18181/m.29809 type:complete len:99 (-) Transcript_18181:4-300(-)